MKEVFNVAVHPSLWWSIPLLLFLFCSSCLLMFVCLCSCEGRRYVAAEPIDGGREQCRIHRLNTTRCGAVQPWVEQHRKWCLDVGDPVLSLSEERSSPCVPKTLEVLLLLNRLTLISPYLVLFVSCVAVKAIHLLVNLKHSCAVSNHELHAWLVQQVIYSLT